MWLTVKMKVYNGYKIGKDSFLYPSVMKMSKKQSYPDESFNRMFFIMITRHGRTHFCI